MNTTLRFTASELESLIRASLPLRIDLSNPEDGTRTLDVDAITSVSLIPSVGIRAVGHVRVEWPVLGIQIPATVDDLELHVLLSISGQGDDATLRVQFQIEDADIRNVPGFIEKPVIAKVNAALVSDAATISWGLGKTISTRVALPKMLMPARTLALGVVAATLSVSEAALALEASLTMSVSA